MENKLPEEIMNPLEEVERRFKSIPFGNSLFQTEHFIINDQHSPARQYRAIGLQMMSKINTLKENHFSMRLRQVDMDEKRHIIETTNNDFERRRAEIELEQLQSGQAYEEKLRGDALAELDFLYSKLKEYPEFSRDDFERQEQTHFIHDLSMKARLGDKGAVMSLSKLQEQMKIEDNSNG